MSYKLTYSTMFNPPPEVHAQFDAAMQRLKVGLGANHALFVDGGDRPAQRTSSKLNPADQDEVLGHFAAASAADADAAMITRAHVDEAMVMIEASLNDALAAQTSAAKAV